jgi:predicted DNA-binding transcriptional regulator YafY
MREKIMTDSQHDKLFTRVLKTLQILSESGSVKVQDLAEEFEVDKRTIYRDIKRLHFFPLELRQGTVYIMEGFNIEHSKLEDDELLIAELAFNSIGNIDATISKKLQSIRAKLSNPLFFTPYNIKEESFESINMNSVLLNKIEDAIKKRNIAKVTSNDKVSSIAPYKIVAFDGFWYLLAKDMADKKLKTYLVSSIQEFRASVEVYATEHVDIDKILQNVHTAWFEDGNSFSVKVKIKKEVAHYFKLKKHLSSQEILKENKDGSIIVTFKVSSDEDVDNLIKSWLPHIEVLQPSRFRKKLQAELELYLKELKSISL